MFSLPLLSLTRRGAWLPLGAWLLTFSAPASAEGAFSKPQIAPSKVPDKPILAVETGAISSGLGAPQTQISPAKRVKVASKSRFAASRVASDALSPNPIVPRLAAPLKVAQIPAKPLQNSVLAKNLVVPVPNLARVTSLAPLSVITPPGATPPNTAPARAAASGAAAQFPIFPSVSLSAPRDRMARLPSRGGLAPNRAPIELRQSAPEIAISDSQRRLLASLDADLSRAQRRLDRADTRLGAGQRQLSSFTDALRSAMLDTGDDGRGLHPFVRVSQRYLGTPYVWGGESARGFDCSGFIMRVMRDLGYRALPHSAAEQFRYGSPVSRALLKPGDLVFFANTYKPGISHVGIYLGKGRFINAANSKVGTIVSGLDEPKWADKYAGARRLLPVKS